MVHKRIHHYVVFTQCKNGEHSDGTTVIVQTERIQITGPYKTVK
jgi:hypothetical protein